MNPLPILQVEDEESDIFMLKTVFQRVGITNPLHVVTDGQMALDYLSGAGPYADRRKYPVPCLILLDLKLPKVGGMDLLAWLRQQRDYKHTVVIIFSSSAQPADLQRAYDLGANSFIQKPSDFQANLRFAQTLKDWWLDLNSFAPGCETHYPAPLT